jgi:SAM-dependent methyltransferase
MARGPQPATYYLGCNQALLRAVPAHARVILEVGCGAGRLGAALKNQDPRRTVYGLEREPAIAERAAAHLDRVFGLDVEAEEPPLAPGSLDCLLYGDVLEHLHDPEAVLARHRRLLAPGGSILCSVPNVQHHSVLTALLRGDFPYAPAGLLDATHLRFFTYASFFKLLLDAGYAPDLLDVVTVPGDPAFLEAARPLLERLSLHPERTRRYLEAYQYVFRADPLPELPRQEEDTEPLTFVACVCDEPLARDNLLASPCLGPGTPHEVLLARGCRSAAEGLNVGLARARHRLVVCVHQDVYLPRGWPARLRQQLARAEQAGGPIGVAGVYGVARQGASVTRAGHVIDRDRRLREPLPLPAAVETLDELALIVPAPTRLRFDSTLGFHLYGADLCLQAQAQGLRAVALDAPCLHNSLTVGLHAAFTASGRLLARKWRQRLPVATSCADFDARWLAEKAPE